MSGDPPTLICINDAKGHAHAAMRGFYKDCQSDPRIFAISPEQSNNIMLCPRFFDLRLGPQPRDCATVNHANTRLIPAEGNNGWMLGTQYGVLIEALANIYIPLSTTKQPLLFDIIEVNHCLDLRPDDALVNPGSYAYLASSKLTIDVCVPHSMIRSADRLNYQDIRAGCTRFPTKPRERELIEVNNNALSGSNGTKLLTLGCSGSEVNSSSCSG